MFLFYFTRYICSYCGKGFNLHFNLKDHMNEHTGERPYICSICGKAFGKASHRVAHLRVSNHNLSLLFVSFLRGLQLSTPKRYSVARRANVSLYSKSEFIKK